MFCTCLVIYDLVSFYKSCLTMISVSASSRIDLGLYIISGVAEEGNYCHSYRRRSSLIESHRRDLILY